MRLVECSSDVLLREFTRLFPLAGAGPVPLVKNLRSIS
jgi:hypothetical protein